MNNRTDRKHCGLIVPLCLAYVINAQADEGYSRIYFTCVNQPGITTVSLHSCITAELKAQDRRLNEAYQQLAATLAPDQKQQVLDAQRQWIKYRDANCKFYSNQGDKISIRFNVDNCLLGETSHRAFELENLKTTLSAH